MSTFLFPGQGSQCKGMGDQLFQAFPEYTKMASDILGYSIETLCLEDTQDQLNQTQYTQPALYVVNALTYYQKIADAPKPEFVAGHSLGEYNALLAADVFNFETGLRLVQKRGELMSQQQGGAMMAIVGLNIDKIKTILAEKPFSNVFVANHNAPTQIVVSGLADEIAQAKPLFESAGAKLARPLKVSGAFHSPFMADAKAAFGEFAQSFSFNTPTVPVVANTTARPYTADDLPSQLIMQITQPVRWTESIEWLMREGQQTEFTEVGPGKVLTGLVKRICAACAT